MWSDGSRSPRRWICRTTASAICYPAICAAAPVTSTSSPRCVMPPNFSDGLRARWQMSTRTFGARIERNVDPKLLRGEGAFVDDIPLPESLPVAFARSPFAPARIRSIDTRIAKKRPGIVAVYTCEDIGDLDIEM